MQNIIYFLSLNSKNLPVFVFPADWLQKVECVSKNLSNNNWDLRNTTNETPVFYDVRFLAAEGILNFKKLKFHRIYCGFAAAVFLSYCAI